MSVALAALGVAVPITAAIYEFVVKGRKRLGYRVQMDTSATDVAETTDPGALAELRRDGVRLTDPTLVLLRIENNGATFIDASDYVGSDEDKIGLRVRFPGRKVVGMVVTELSDDYLRPAFQNGSGLSARGDVVELPKVPMNRADHYKVLAALDRADGVPPPPDGEYDAPVVIGGIKGGVRGGKIVATRSRIGTPKRTIALIGFLVVLVVAQLAVFVRGSDVKPLDCAAGRLTVVGSTAFQPIVRQAAESYRKTCSDASFAFDMRGSGEGADRLNRLRRADVLAFSDGERPAEMAELVARPIALFLFTLVVNPEAGVRDLSIEQIQRIYRGGVRNWREVGGEDVPIRLISRNPGSGTRSAFQRRVLGGVREPGSNSDNCRDVDPGAPSGVVRCARDSTEDVLRAVAETPGALGYGELTAAAAYKTLVPVLIGGRKPAPDGTYPFWETEFGYTHGVPAPGSLTASFLRYLTNQVGADIIRSHGDSPCAELANPRLCRPELTE